MVSNDWSVLAKVVFALSLATVGQCLTDLDINPTEIKLGLDATDSIEVNCSYTGSVAVDTLILERRIGPTADVIFSANFESGDELLGALIAGREMVTLVKSTGLFMNIKVSNPGEELGGVYGCRAKTVNASDQPLVRPIYQLVQVTPLDPRSLVNRFGNLSQEYTDLQDEFDNLPEAQEPLNYAVEIARLEDMNFNLSLALQDAQKLINETKEILELAGIRLNESATIQTILDTSLFFISDVYAGSRYHLSAFSPTSFQGAEEICRLRGGYLAEITDDLEFDYMNFFLRTYISQQQYVLFGAVYNASGPPDYVYRHSGNPVTFTDFHPFTPNGDLTDENCLALVLNWQGYGGLRMEDVNCDFTPENDLGYYPAFLCEVETA